MSKQSRYRSLGRSCLAALILSVTSGLSALDLNFTPNFLLDQQSPKAAFGNNGGVVIWQDLQSADGKFTIKGMKLSSGLAVENGVFLINEEVATGFQENASVVATQDGGFVYTWQGGIDAHQKIYLRFQDSGLVFKGAPIEVTRNPGYHEDPSVAVGDSKALVVWHTFNGTSSSAHDVFGRFYDLDGNATSEAFILSRKITDNQKNPVAVSTGGDTFAVVWVDEQPNLVKSESATAQHLVRLVGKIIQSPADSFTNDTYLSSPDVFAANPSISRSSSGVKVAFSGKKHTAGDDSWDIYLVSTSDSLANTSQVKVNTITHGDQYAPSIATFGESSLIAWNSMGQDGSGQGVYANDLSGGSDFLVNATTFGHQMQATVASLSSGSSAEALVLWSGFNSVQHGFDIFGSIIRNEAAIPPAPLVYAYPVSSSRIQASFTTPVDVPASEFEIAISGGNIDETVSSDSNSTTVSNLAPGSTVSFSVRYKDADGTFSEWSDAVTATTWGVDDNFDGLPDDWQKKYFGDDFLSIPAGHLSAVYDYDGDGASNLSEFLAGTNPNDSSSVLKISISRSQSSFILTWNSIPGGRYLLEGSSDLKSWNPFGNPHFATDFQDSTVIDDPQQAIYFRLTKIR